MKARTHRMVDSLIDEFMELIYERVLAYAARGAEESHDFLSGL